MPNLSPWQPGEPPVNQFWLHDLLIFPAER